MEEELRRSRDELEIKVQERTAALVRANELLERMFSNIDIMIAYMDKDFNFIRVNRAYAEADERTPDFYIGKNHFVLFPNEENEQIFRKVVETGEPYSVYAKPFEYAENLERGVTHWDWSLQPVKEPDGNVGGVVLSLVNVTERIRAQEAVKTERQRFHDVLEMLPAYVVLLTPDYHVPFANRVFRERFGESHGQRCFEYLFGRSEPCVTCETYTVLKTKGPHHWEWTGPDGRNYDVFDFPFTDTDGSTLILEMGIDITERKRAEEALRAASLDARSLIESSLDPLVTISRDGKIMDVNRTTELVTGFSRAELIGTDFSDYFTEPEKAREGYQRVFLEGSVRDYPLAIKDRSGRLTEVLYHATVYRNETGEIQGVFAAARDVTERNEIERRLQATNALLDLFSKLSHFREYLDAAVNLLSVWSGCRCVGIRVLDPKGYIPYESYSGFSREFWELETFLSIQRDQCACVRVISGELEPQEACVVTPGGSFCCGNTLKFIEALTEEEKSRYRGNCMKYGFLSVAIVPIRYKEKIVGAVHLADEGEERITFKSVEFIESMAPLIGEAVNRFKLEEELRESENRLRLLSSRLLTVQEQERKRVAHELHDGIGQMLTAVKFKVEDTLQQMARSRSRPKQALETIVPVIQQTVEEVRRIQMDLRPSLLDDIGILSTIGWFTREFQKVFTTLQIEKRIDILEEQVPDSLKVVIFRVIQEALNNIAKHSKADLASLSLKKSDGKLELAIGDNGQGFDLDGVRSKESPEKGFGLSSMRERTELSGGTFSIESTIGKGTTIRASWPV
jgi:PAS domain S-box-containing protein